ncbi:hypothetical protein B0H10DRAFT_2432558 [Mycena sp. CBHHK59/15]|nr:hypothetical protein B0H10DRAFT_2432558 [Mycena sp. CBHHK59/15]
MFNTETMSRRPSVLREWLRAGCSSSPTSHTDSQPRLRWGAPVIAADSARLAASERAGSLTDLPRALPTAVRVPSSYRAASDETPRVCPCASAQAIPALGRRARPLLLALRHARLAWTGRPRRTLLLLHFRSSAWLNGPPSASDSGAVSRAAALPHVAASPRRRTLGAKRAGRLTRALSPRCAPVLSRPVPSARFDWGLDQTRPCLRELAGRCVREQTRASLALWAADVHPSAGELGWTLSTGSVLT